jgi:hypothetical protein
MLSVMMRFNAVRRAVGLPHRAAIQTALQEFDYGIDR